MIKSKMKGKTYDATYIEWYRRGIDLKNTDPARLIKGTQK